jgi:hypothetical protein
MKFEPGQLVEITGTIDTAPDGTAVQTLSFEYIGKLALVISYNEKNALYHVLVGNEDETIEVYEEEIRLV